MTPDELQALSGALGKLIGPHLSQSAEWRTVARMLGTWLIAEADRAEPAASAASAEDGRQENAIPPPVPGGALTPGRPPGERAAPKAPWTIGDLLKGPPGATGQAAPVMSMPANAPIVESDPLVVLDLIEQRTALKAASCRLVIERRAVEIDPAQLTPVLDRISEVLVHAKTLPDCFLWALWRERTPPADEALATIAACYDALGRATTLVRRALDPDLAVKADEWVIAFTLMAEASSSLRIALRSSWLTTPDTDQEAAHIWLRNEVERRGVWVSHYMRLDDPADPGQVARLVTDIGDKLSWLDGRAAHRTRVRDALGLVAYHARRAVRDGADGDALHLTRVAEGIAQLLDLRILPSDRRFVDRIPPELVERVWPHASSPVRAVLDHVSAAAQRPKETSASSRREPAWSAEVDRARGLLSGKRVVMIGGQPRPELTARIEAAFDLSVLDWIRMTEHGSSEPMRGPIGHRDTALVIVLIRLTGHQHAEDAAALAKAAGTPWVFMAAGYSPEQIAHAVLERASDRLVLPV